MNEALAASMKSARKLKSLSIGRIDHHFFDPDNAGLEIAYDAISELEAINIQIDQDWHKSKEVCICCIERQLIEEGKLPPNPDSGRTCICGNDVEKGREDDEETDDQAARRVMRAYQDDRMSWFLSKAPNLRELTFKGPPASDSHAPLRLSLILGKNRWTHLSRLDLTQFTATDEELSEVILNYKTTLKHLALRRVCIIGSWRGALRKIGGKLAVLESVRLRGYIVSDDQPFALQYDPDVGPCEGKTSPDGPEEFILSGDPLVFPAPW